MAYAAARALLTGTYTLKDLRNASHMDDETRALIHRMEIISDSSLEIREKRIRGARMEVVLKDGSVRMKGVSQPKGDPEDPADTAAIRQKLSDCAEGVYSEEKMDRITESTLNFDKGTGVSAWIEQFAWTE